MVKNLIFDLGGVFLDIDKSRALPEFKKLGLENVAEYLDEYHQNGFFLDLENGKLSAEEFCAEMSRHCGREISFAMAYGAWMSFVTGMDLRKLELVTKLREKYKIYLLSNTNPFVMDWARSQRFTPWEKRLDDFFDGLFLSCELCCVKPDREIFDHLTTATGILPCESLFIDDGPANIAAGANLGFQTLLVECCQDWRPNLLNYLADNQ